MTWTNADNWAASLTYGGLSDWRLPTTIDTGNPGCGAPGEFSLTGGTSCGQNVITTPGTPNASELAHMLAVTLGNTPAFNTSGGLNPTPWLANTGPFSGIYEFYNVVNYGGVGCADNTPGQDPRDCRDDAYWTNVGIAIDPNSAWKFLFGEGEQIGDNKNVEFFARAVHDGDAGNISAVPLPAAVWLFGSGLGPPAPHMPKMSPM